MIAALATAAVLCRGGAPVLPVVVAPRASARVRATARELAASLGRVCGKPFRVEEGDGSRGVALGTGTGTEFDAEEPLRREQYVLRSHAAGVSVVGATDAAVEAAAADLLHRVGWRRFFPGRAWEVVPHEPDLAVNVAVKTAPAFATRDVWYGFGATEPSREAFREWSRANRLPGAFELRSGHAFEEIVARNKKAFDAHPEYLGLVGGERRSSKLCLSNPALRALVAEDAAARLAESPESDTVSIEPSDGEGWCECDACRALGSPSDRMLLLGNEVSARLKKDRPAKYAAFYAYHRHAPPPAAGTADERLLVSVATAFLPKGATPEGLLAGWRARGVKRLGLYEYWGVFQWHRSLPGRMRGGDLDYLGKSLPRFHALGVRFVSAESGEDWGANGLGYYAASRILWDLDEAARLDALREDFFLKAFGDAREPMRRFYALIDGGRRFKPSEIPADLVPSMYARLAQARAATRDPAVVARLDDLVLYTRYVELYAAYQTAVLGRQDAFAALVRHARRMRPRMMVHTHALTQYMPEVDPLVKVPADDAPPDYTPAEVAALLEAR